MNLRSGLLIACAALIACRSNIPSEPREKPWFRDAASESGINFTHVTGGTGQFYMPEIMGSGGAFLDYDSDGDLDVLLLQGAPLDARSTGPGSRLFRNDSVPSGKLRFTDVTVQAGLDFSGYAMGVATGDVNSDGRIDMVITGYGGNAVYRNEGGRFRDVTRESPDILLAGQWSSSAAFLDYDRDGLQDVLILNYLDYSIRVNKVCRAPSGEVTYCTPKAYPATIAYLFRNDGRRFTDVTKKAGLNQALGRGLGVATMDANGDGWPDIFIANDASANHLWINRKNGTFVEQALQWGAAYGDEGLAKAGMGVATGDYDDDGDDDILVTNLMREGATLFEKTPSGFADASLRTGIHAITFPYTGFGAGWLDFDGDGWLDLFLANGAVTLREEQRGDPYPFRESNLLIRNGGGGTLTFVDVSSRAGDALVHREVSRGSAFGDVDNDGDIDVLLTNNNGPARLLINDMPRRNWLTVQIEGPGLGFGTRIAVRASGLPELWRRIHTDGSYLSASDTRAHFGLGDSVRIESVTVYWPDGTTTKSAAGINTLLRISKVP